jgi:hypothetical protein
MVRKRKELLKETITELCKDKLPGLAVLALYQYAFPIWDDIDHIKGFPMVSHNTATFILEFIREAGMLLWLNKGFSSDTGLPEADKLPDWIIDYSRVEVFLTPTS